MKDKYDALKLENQLCFPLYACSKEIVRRYKPYLDEIDLTYTQYIAMMVLWEHGRINVKDMGALLYLDSGTLTPVLKKLEQKGYLTRQRDKDDERVLNVTITQQGEALKEQAVQIPRKMQGCVAMDPEDAKTLYRILHKILEAAVALKKRNPKYFKLAYDLVIMYLEPVYKTEDVIIGKTYYALNLFYKKTEAGKEIAIKLAGIPNLIFVPIKNGQVPTRNSIIIVSVIDVVDGKIKVRIVDRCIENKIRMNKIENKPISGFGEQLFQALVKNDKL